MLKKLLNDHQLFHSEFQQDYFITTKAGGTMYGQYKQSLRELYKRFRGLREAYCDREKLAVEIEEQEHIKRYEDDTFKRRYAEIEHRRKSAQMEEIDRLIKDTEREFKRFYQQAEYLKKQIGELTDEKRRKLDEEMHLHKLKEMFIIDKVCNGRISPTTYEFIHSLPPGKRQEFLKQFAGNDFKKTLDDYELMENNYLPEMKDNINIRTLLNDS